LAETTARELGPPQQVLDWAVVALLRSRKWLPGAGGGEGGAEGGDGGAGGGGNGGGGEGGIGGGGLGGGAEGGPIATETRTFWMPHDSSDAAELSVDVTLTVSASFVLGTVAKTAT
jgi:hypothetical protein